MRHNEKHRLFSSEGVMRWLQGATEVGLVNLHEALILDALKF